MASEYIAVEKGTPNSTNYRVFFSEYSYLVFLYIFNNMADQYK